MLVNWKPSPAPARRWLLLRTTKAPTCTALVWACGCAVKQSEHQVFDAAERKRDKKRRKKKSPEQDVEYAYKAPQPDYLASLKKAVVAGEGRWFE